MRQTDTLYSIHHDNDAFHITDPNVDSFNMPYDTSNLTTIDASYISEPAWITKPVFVDTNNYCW